jgi:hypothetical protein
MDGQPLPGAPAAAPDGKSADGTNRAPRPRSAFVQKSSIIALNVPFVAQSRASYLTFQ